MADPYMNAILQAGMAAGAPPQQGVIGRPRDELLGAIMHGLGFTTLAERESRRQAFLRVADSHREAGDYDWLDAHIPPAVKTGEIDANTGALYKEEAGSKLGQARREAFNTEAQKGQVGLQTLQGMVKVFQNRQQQTQQQNPQLQPEEAMNRVYANASPEELIAGGHPEMAAARQAQQELEFHKSQEANTHSVALKQLDIEGQRNGLTQQQIDVSKNELVQNLAIAKQAGRERLIGASATPKVANELIEAAYAPDPEKAIASLSTEAKNFDPKAFAIKQERNQAGLAWTKDIMDRYSTAKSGFGESFRNSSAQAAIRGDAAAMAKTFPEFAPMVQHITDDSEGTTVPGTKPGYLPGLTTGLRSEAATQQPQQPAANAGGNF